jgi:hypothetical protein
MRKILATAIFLPSIAVYSTQLDVTFTGDTPAVGWGAGFSLYDGQDFQYENYVEVANYDNIPNKLAGVTSMQMTWQAPAGYMYVINPPAVDDGLTLALEASFGLTGQAAELGSVTSQSISVNTVYGTSPLSEHVLLDPTQAPNAPALDFNVGTSITPSTKPFAFTSITVTANFSGAGSSASLTPNTDWNETSGFFGVIYGIPTFYGDPYNGPSYPGQLWTLEPLPTGSVPDDSSTMSLAGLGLAGLWLLGSRRSTRQILS